MTIPELQALRSELDRTVCDPVESEAIYLDALLRSASADGKVPSGWSAAELRAEQQRGGDRAPGHS